LTSQSFATQATNFTMNSTVSFKLFPQKLPHVERDPNYFFPEYKMDAED
jgi:hypothetical protein